MIRVKRVLVSFAFAISALGAGATIANAESSNPSPCTEFKEKNRCDAWQLQTGSPDWMKNHDRELGISANVKLDRVQNLSNLKSTLEDGLYIFVYKKNGDFLIRPADREDKGCKYNGDKKYLFPGNRKRQYVRHSQLNGGYEPVLAAGMLEVWDHKVVWISNNSGHFHPTKTHIDNAKTALIYWKVADNSIDTYIASEKLRSVDKATCDKVKNKYNKFNTEILKEIKDHIKQKQMMFTK